MKRCEAFKKITIILAGVVISLVSLASLAAGMLLRHRQGDLE